MDVTSEEQIFNIIKIIYASYILKFKFKNKFFLDSNSCDVKT